MTIDNDLDAVYFNNVDITADVEGFDDEEATGLYHWNVRKTVSFRWNGITTGVLAIAGHEFDNSGSCGASGASLACRPPTKPPFYERAFCPASRAVGGSIHARSNRLPQRVGAHATRALALCADLLISLPTAPLVAVLRSAWPYRTLTISQREYSFLAVCPCRCS
jgi:hypothetical protein